MSTRLGCIGMQFKVVALLCLLIALHPGRLHAAYDTFEIKSVNLDKAETTDGAVDYYRLLPPECVGNSIEDLHPVHGFETSDGGLVYMGKGVDSKGLQQAFVVKVNGETGACIWGWKSGLTGKENSALQGIQLPNGDDILIVGFRNVGGVYKRSITKLALVSGVEQWTATNFGDAKGSHGAWETVDLTLDGKHLVLGGLSKKPSTDEYSFKSYGNTPGGRATVMKFPVSAMTSTSPPASSDATWTKLVSIPGSGNTFFDSCKAIRPVPGGDVAALLYADGSDKWLNAVVMLSSSGSIQWGPKALEGEGTDMVLAEVGSALYVTGHGKPGTSALLTKINVVNGHIFWSKYYRSVPMENSRLGAILNECWGVQPTNDGGAILACGTGIEDCSAFSGNEKKDCKKGLDMVGDTRPGAWPRRAAVWQSLIIRTDSAGELLWMRVDQHRYDEVPALGTPEWEAAGRPYSSSASEFVAKCQDGGFAFVQDEEEGVGVLKLRPGGLSPGPSPAPNPQPSPGPGPAPAPNPQPSPGPGPAPGPSPPDSDACCQNLVSEYGFTYSGNNDVCSGFGEDDGSGCKGRVSYAVSEETCKSVGARLCTLKELENREARRPGGCRSLRRKRVWTSDECENKRGRPGYIVAKAKTGKKPSCMRPKRRAAMLCCSESC